MQSTGSAILATVSSLLLGLATSLPARPAECPAIIKGTLSDFADASNRHRREMGQMMQSRGGSNERYASRSGVAAEEVRAEIGRFRDQVSRLKATTGSSTPQIGVLL